MAHQWVQMNHAVTMISEFPNHPSGIMPPKYNGKFFEKSNLDGIEVIRVWVKASPVKNFLNRMLFYLSYMVNAIIIGLFLVRGRYDLLYATSPPLIRWWSCTIIKLSKTYPIGI